MKACLGGGVVLPSAIFGPKQSKRGGGLGLQVDLRTDLRGRRLGFHPPSPEPNIENGGRVLSSSGSKIED